MEQLCISFPSIACACNTKIFATQVPMQPIIIYFVRQYSYDSYRMYIHIASEINMTVNHNSTRVTFQNESWQSISMTNPPVLTWPVLKKTQVVPGLTSSSSSFSVSSSKPLSSQQVSFSSGQEMEEVENIRLSEHPFPVDFGRGSFYIPYQKSKICTESTLWN